MSSEVTSSRVAERGHVGGAGGGGAEEHADLGDAPAHPALGEEDAPRVLPVDEEVELLVEPRARGVDEVDDGAARALRLLLLAVDLADGLASPGARLHGEVVGDDTHRPPADRAHAADHAVGGEALVHRPGEQPVLDEGAGVEQRGDAVAGEALARGGERLVGGGRSALPRARDAAAELREGGGLGVAHFLRGGVPPLAAAARPPLLTPPILMSKLMAAGSP